MEYIPMYQPSNQHIIYHDESQRARQPQTLHSQLGYYQDQHALQQQQAAQGIGLSEPSAVYARQYAPATYDPMSIAYTMPQTGYTVGLPITDDLHHSYAYPRLMQPGLLPGMSDEADTASRPRLTAEQTRELEALYAANNKPSTQQKQEYAQRFRLTKNRVDNWFQNRRAKSKHQNKAKQAELAMANLTKTDGEALNSADASNQGHQTYETYNMYGSDDGTSQNTPTDLLASSVSYTNEKAQDVASDEEEEYASIQNVSWDTQSKDVSNFQPSMNMAYSEHPEHQLIASHKTCTSPSSMSLKSFDYKTPSAGATTYSIPNHLTNEYSPESFARRGSTLSELASHMDGIRMLPSDQTPTQEMFVGMEVPRRGLGDRRPQRPAALSTMRSTSSGASLRSPLLVGSPVPHALRRINTCGTPLNRTGRVQKNYGTMTPQRSPRAFGHALERSLDSIVPQQMSAESATTEEQIDNFEQVSDDTDSNEAEVVFNVNPPSAEVAWMENNNVDFPVPPLSASLTGDDGSPPVTPLPGQGGFADPWASQDMSAITSASVPSSYFAHTSPLGLQEQSQCLAPQAQHSLQHFWDNTNVGDVYSMPSAYDFAQAHISRPASLGPHFSYGSFSRRDEPLKIEFSHPYQDREQQPYYVPLRENQNYTFQEYNPNNGRRE